MEIEARWELCGVMDVGMVGEIERLGVIDE